MTQTDTMLKIGTALRIGTRGSPLALAQAHETAARLKAAHPGLPEPEIVVIKTTGDKVLDRPLAEIGGKGLFTKEIEEALLAGGIDLAVHSMKDVPTQLPPGLEISCLLPREDPRDALVGATGLADLPQGAVIGSASLRRQAQLLHLRPDLVIVPLRGNVNTRLAKLAAGEVRATLLALAGLKRLGFERHAGGLLDTQDMLPAVAQGAIGIETRIGDEAVNLMLAPLNHPDTAICVAAERALLTELEGSCRTPIAAHARLLDGVLHLTARLASTDGRALWEAKRSGAPGDGVKMGHDAGRDLRAQAGPASPLAS